MERNKFGATWSYLPEGCRLCLEGAKLVLFITGKCNSKCWYCPISFERKNKDLVYANERPVKTPEEAAEEAIEMNALGVGITGGEPFLAIKTVVKYLKFLKEKFGKNFHAHLYTYGNLANEKNIRELEEAGLDEIRFHSLNGIEHALKSKMNVGIEVPVIPGQKDYLKEIVNFCSKNNIFLNLNEFEFSDTNIEEMEKRHFKHPEFSYAVEGSKKLALEIVRYAISKNVKVNFCSLQNKYYGQLNERNKRRAEIIKKSWQKIDENGMLVFGALECDEEIAKKLNLEYDKKEKYAECDLKDLKLLAKKYKLKAYKIILYPTYKPWVFEKDPVN
ncbi:MAG: radical SAM protein [Nanoarchaeota archaeon]|nr:radical SAM protein [Nanoarchaeota archaeon]